MPVGSHVEHYRIDSVLGAGGFGITYLGWDTRLECKVAIKEFLPNEMSIREKDGATVIARSTHQREDFTYGLARFLDEARTLAKFSEPNIISVKNFLEANGTAYMVMDYEEGEPLDTLLKREGTLDEATIKAIIIPILDGLRAVHAAEFLHRDIKPGNIYLRKDGPPVLIDFGAARQALGEHSRSMTGIVSAGYAPFEQYSSRGRQGPWTDLYAIGATLYRCITGHAPVEASERIAAMGEDEPDPLIPAAEIGKGQYSQSLLRAIDWMLKPAAKDRPQTVSDVLDLLLGRTSQSKQHQSASTDIATQKTQAIQASTKRRSGKLKWAGIAAVLLGGLAIGAWWINKTIPVDTNADTATTQQQPNIQGAATSAANASREQRQDSPVLSKAATAKTAPPPPPKGHLQISVNVAKASIMLDGVELGIASSGNPLNRRGLLPGKYKLRIEAPGYLPREQTIQIMRNAWEQVVVQLQAEPKQQPFEPVMVEIPGGSFLMGDLSGDGDEKPVHKVQVKSFLLAETETTFAQWDACVDAGDCSNKPGDKDQGHGDTPVTNVSWEDIQEYIAWLNISTGKSYRLPSESEWEYAARAGSATKYSWGDGIDCTKARYGFSYNQCGKQQSPDLVKSYQANAYGLFDMHGNVWEWVGDCWNRSYHGAPSDGSVWNSDHCESRVLRGGSWFNKPSGLRSAIRGGYDASIRGSRSGFRLARDP